MKKLIVTLALLAACQFDTSEPIDPAPAGAAPTRTADTDIVDEGECTTPDHVPSAPEVVADPRVRLGADAKALPALTAPTWTPPPVAPEVLAAQERYDAETAALTARLSGDDLAAARRDLKERLLGAM